MSSEHHSVNDVAPDGEPFQVLFECPDLPCFDVSRSLAAAYGTGLGFSSPCVLANFVASVDGVVALATAGESGHTISQNSAADRFVMGLLRACVEAVIVGAGTFRKAPGHLWHADAIYPAAAALFAQTRSRLGLHPEPKLVIVSGSGMIDMTQPAVLDALIVTTPTGEARLRAQKPSTTGILVSDSAKIRMTDVLALLQGEGLRTLLTEGGPSTLAGLVAEKLLDELFVTLSPSLFGRYPNDGRKSLADGLDLTGNSLKLLSARRHGSHLFLRYALQRRSG
jgi:riboflavin biosynthesis pyrimidine reductase